MKDKQKRHLPSALQDNVLSLIAILSVLALTLAVVFTMLWLLDRAEIVSFTDRFFPSETDASGEGGNNMPSAYDILREEAENGDGSSDVIRFSGSFETLHAILSQSEVDRSYYAEYETTVGDGEGALSHHVTVLRHGDAFHIRRAASTDAYAVEQYFCDGNTVTYTDPYTQKSATFAPSDAFFAEALAGIPTVASFCNDTEKVIDTAAYTEINGEVVYYVRFHHPSQTENEKQIYEEYWISAERELVIRCSTYAASQSSEESTLLFSFETKVMRDPTDTERKTLLPPTKTEEAK